MTWRGGVEWLEEGSERMFINIKLCTVPLSLSQRKRNFVSSSSFGTFAALLISTTSPSSSSLELEGPRRRTETPNLKSPAPESSFFHSISSVSLRSSAMSPFDVPESDKITLVTADEPPQHFIVSRSRLMVLSNVFRDLLSTPTTAEDEAKGEIRLTEKAPELKGFLMVLQDEEDQLSKLYFGDWYALARMADKFDCQAASNAALMRAW